VPESIEHDVSIIGRILVLYYKPNKCDPILENSHKQKLQQNSIEIFINIFWINFLYIWNKKLSNLVGVKFHFFLLGNMDDFFRPCRDFTTFGTAINLQIRWFFQALEWPKLSVLENDTFNLISEKYQKHWPLSQIGSHILYPIYLLYITKK